jgi:hypothetical protein
MTHIDIDQNEGMEAEETPAADERVDEPPPAPTEPRRRSRAWWWILGIAIIADSRGHRNLRGSPRQR